MENVTVVRRESIVAIRPIDETKNSYKIDDFPVGTLVVYKGYATPVGIVVNTAQGTREGMPCVEVVWSEQPVKYLRITSNGSVGIGINAPTTKLEFK